MRSFITVIGKDTVGILAKVSTVCANNGANVVEVSQTVLQGMFAMIMMVEMEKLVCEPDDFRQQLDDLGGQLGMAIHIMHEDIFNSMHRI